MQLITNISANKKVAYFVINRDKLFYGCCKLWHSLLESSLQIYGLWKQEKILIAGLFLVKKLVCQGNLHRERRMIAFLWSQPCGIKIKCNLNLMRVCNLMMMCGYSKVLSASRELIFVKATWENWGVSTFVYMLLPLHSFIPKSKWCLLVCSVFCVLLFLSTRIFTKNLLALNMAL